MAQDSESEILHVNLFFHIKSRICANAIGSHLSELLTKAFLSFRSRPGCLSKPRLQPQPAPLHRHTPPVPKAFLTVV